MLLAESFLDNRVFLILCIHKFLLVVGVSWKISSTLLISFLIKLLCSKRGKINTGHDLKGSKSGSQNLKRLPNGIKTTKCFIFLSEEVFLQVPSAIFLPLKKWTGNAALNYHEKGVNQGCFVRWGTRFAATWSVGQFIITHYTCPKLGEHGAGGYVMPFHRKQFKRVVLVPVLWDSTTHLPGICKSSAGDIVGCHSTDRQSQLQLLPGIFFYFVLKILLSRKLRNKPQNGQ